MYRSMFASSGSNCCACHRCLQKTPLVRPSTPSLCEVYAVASSSGLQQQLPRENTSNRFCEPLTALSPYTFSA